MPVLRNSLTGVFLGSSAIAAGALTERQLRDRGYRRLTHGVYADPALTYDHRLRCTGVALLLPPGTAIGGHSAAAWYGAPFAAAGDPVTVVRPPTVEWKGPRDVRVHRTDLRHGDVVDHDGVPVTSAFRTAWDVAALEPLATAVAALDGMVRAQAVDLPLFRAAVATERRRWRLARVRRAVALVDPRAESPPESWVRVALALAGLTPVPQHEVRSGGELIARVDLAWPEARVALEYEGAYHFDGVQIVRDDVRYARLRAAGWTVIRVGAADLRDLDGVVARVRAVLASA